MITIDDFKSNTKEWLIDELESLSREDALQTISNLYNELHKPKYPKTYEECCDILKIPNDARYIITDVPLGYSEVLFPFTQLLICRDAYWKIIRDWKPDWKNISDKYCMYIVCGDIWFDDCQTRQCTLTFPTIEMRDAFYENFKDLIEQCKELL